MNSSYFLQITIFIRYYWTKIFNLTGFLYIRNLMILLLIDSLLLDDEPLWEPIEWSVMQTWILYIYIFSWIAETIFSSRYGSYTNRDKIVWSGLYKVYTYLKLWFILNIIIITLFVTMPFYFEISYSISYIVVWWNWVTSIYFFKITTYFMIIFIILLLLKFLNRWSFIRSYYILLIIVMLITTYIFYFNFILVLFGYFTDYQNFQLTSWSKFNDITQGPLKWGWGSASRDNFSYHRTPNVFWFKNDPLIAGSLLFLHLFFFQFMLFFYIQVLTLVRVVYTSNTISFTLLSYFQSSVKEFYLSIVSLVLFIFISLLYQFIRFPFELLIFNKFLLLWNLELNVIYDLLEMIYVL
jgi:hypothetical protein